MQTEDDSTNTSTKIQQQQQEENPLSKYSIEEILSRIELIETTLKYYNPSSTIKIDTEEDKGNNFTEVYLHFPNNSTTKNIKLPQSQKIMTHSLTRFLKQTFNSYYTLTLNTYTTTTTTTTVKDYLNPSYPIELKEGMHLYLREDLKYSEFIKRITNEDFIVDLILSCKVEEGFRVVMCINEYIQPITLNRHSFGNISLMEYLLSLKESREYLKGFLLLYLCSDSVLDYEVLYKEIILSPPTETDGGTLGLLEFYGILLDRVLNHYNVPPSPPPVTISYVSDLELLIRKFLFLCSVVELYKNQSNVLLSLMLRLILVKTNGDGLIEYIIQNNTAAEEFVLKVANEMLFIDYVKNTCIKRKKELLYNLVENNYGFNVLYELLLVLFRDTKEYSLLVKGITSTSKSYNQMILVKIYTQLYNQEVSFMDDDDDDDDGILSLEELFKGIVKEYYFPSTNTTTTTEGDSAEVVMVDETVVLLYNLLSSKLNSDSGSDGKGDGDVIVIDQDVSSVVDFSNCLKVVDLLEYLIPFDNIIFTSSSAASVVVVPRSSTGKKGLVNLGATCYMNSLLQQLFYIKGFREKVLNYDLDSVDRKENNNSRELLKQLQWLFMQLKYSLKGYVSTRDFAQQCAFYGNSSGDHDDGDGSEEKNSLLNVNQQMDVDEYYNLLFDRLESFDLVQDLFRGEHEMKIQSKQCLHCSKRLELFYSLQLNVVKIKNVRESLQQEYSKEELLEGENQYKCEQCEPARKVDAAKTLRLKSLPPVLFVSLKRFEFDFQKMIREKVNDSFEFYAEMDLGEHCCDSEETEAKLGAGVKREREDSLSADDVPPSSSTTGAAAPPPLKKPSVKYRLKGVLVHIGTADSGHYYSYVQDRDTGLWWLFNDAQVYPYDPQDIPKDCFGGGNYSAYILVYERDSGNEEILKVKHSDNYDRLMQKVMEDNYKYGIQLLVNDQRMYSLVDGMLKNVSRDCSKVPKKLLRFLLKFRFFVLSAVNTYASRTLMTRVEKAILEAVLNGMELEIELIQFITSNSSRVGLASNSEFLCKLLKQLKNKSPLPEFLKAVFEAANLVLCNDILEALPREETQKFVDANVKGRIKDIVESIKSIDITSLDSKEGLSGASTPASSSEHSEYSEAVKFLYLLREFLPIQMIGSIVSVLIRMQLPVMYEEYHVGLVAFYFLSRYFESNEAEDACFVFDILQSDTLHEMNMKILFSAQRDVLYHSGHDLDARNFLTSLLKLIQEHDDKTALKTFALKFLTEYENPDLTEQLYLYSRHWIVTYLGQYQPRQVRIAAFNLANRLYFTEQDGQESVPQLTALLVSRMKKFIIYDAASSDGDDVTVSPHIEQYCSLLRQSFELLIKTKSLHTEVIESLSERYELLFYWIKEFLDCKNGSNFKDLHELLKLLRLIMLDVDAEGVIDFMVENPGNALLICDLPIRSSYSNAITKFNSVFVPDYYWLLSDIIQESAKLDHGFCNYLSFCLATQSKSLQYSITEYLCSKDELDVNQASSVLDLLMDMVDKYIFTFVKCIQAGNLRSVYQDLRRIPWPELCDPIIHTYTDLLQDNDQFRQSCQAEVSKRRLNQIQDRALGDELFKSIQVLEFLRLVNDYIDISKSDNGGEEIE